MDPLTHSRPLDTPMRRRLDLHSSWWHSLLFLILLYTIFYSLIHRKDFQFSRNFDLRTVKAFLDNLFAVRKTHRCRKPIEVS